MAVISPKADSHSQKTAAGLPLRSFFHFVAPHHHSYVKTCCNCGLLVCTAYSTYNRSEVMTRMEQKNIIFELRNKIGLSQDELAEKVYVTRQAVSRWENNETTPNTETLKLLSKLFDVSINTLLGSPREMVCHCCGMALDDSTTSKEIDGIFNKEYCKWCYHDGKFTLDFWKRYAELGGEEKLKEFKNQLIAEFNELYIPGLPKIESLNVLSGSFINLEYTLPNGQTVKFLDDNSTYLGNQLPCEFGGDRCFGIAANMDFLLVCTYEENGKNPALVIYKKR